MPLIELMKSLTINDTQLLFAVDMVVGNFRIQINNTTHDTKCHVSSTARKENLIAASPATNLIAAVMSPIAA